ncbi:nitrilase-related carbon-nitrogen hydrolase [Rhodococcus sp. JVH1]|uniref:nitrilase-related carbon-nitrogen hydrolase n=1 Tax=Rhodococcus sp. JVH1 TaxID=745408 RepID=UPI000272030B|nr:nitrilase-related carbon-nitrogen hydrolase [Rhodococcus sp. JVH1]EJI98248.1 carbon-nitrogen hydrolase family protein [Rhodococcus sp. JVH1]
MPRIASCSTVFRNVPDFESFAAHMVEVLDHAAGADLVVLPELVTFELMTAVPGWQDATDLQPAVRTADFADRYREFMSAEARRRQQHVLAGSHLVQTEDGRLLNVAPLFGPTGRLLHEHAKTHLFPLEFTLDIAEGDDMKVVDLPFARIGVNICYEAEIPECSASLVEQGAHIILCPSLTLNEAGFWRVRHCLAARSIENQVFTVHAGSASPPRGPWPGTWAQSALLGPCDTRWPADGVLAQTPPNIDAVAIADLDLNHLEDNRSSGAATTFADRRRRADRYRAWPTHVTTASTPVHP